MLKGLVAGTVNLALAFWHGAVLPPAGPILGAGAVGFVGYGISLVLFVLALRHLGTAMTGAYFSMAPFIGAVLAIVLFGEPVTAHLVAAAVLMGVGFWLHLVEHHEHEHVHEEAVHEHLHVHDGHHQHAHVAGDPPGEPHGHLPSAKRSCVIGDDGPSLSPAVRRSLIVTDGPVAATRRNS